MVSQNIVQQRGGPPLQSKQSTPAEEHAETLEPTTKSGGSAAAASVDALKAKV
jgi:hypothetical protein